MTVSDNLSHLYSPDNVMPRSSSVNHSDRLVQSALKLAAEQGWNAVTLDQIVADSGVKAAAASAIAAEKKDLIPLIAAYIDTHVERQLEGGVDGTLHDRLFECLMARFDVLQENRDGILVMMKDLKTEPCAWVPLVPGRVQAVTSVLQYAGIELHGPRRTMWHAGVMAVYLAALRVWVQDQSEDMSKTMAELDRRLQQAGRVAQWLQLDPQNE